MSESNQEEVCISHDDVEKGNAEDVKEVESLPEKSENDAEIDQVPGDESIIKNESKKSSNKSKSKRSKKKSFSKSKRDHKKLNASTGDKTESGKESNTLRRVSLEDSEKRRRGSSGSTSSSCSSKRSSLSVGAEGEGDEKTSGAEEDMATRRNKLEQLLRISGVTSRTSSMSRAEALSKTKKKSSPREVSKQRHSALGIRQGRSGSLDSKSSSPLKKKEQFTISIHEICFNGEVDTLRKLLSSDKYDEYVKQAVTQDMHGVTALHVCIGSRADKIAQHLTCLKSLIESGCNPNAIDFNGSTPVHLAANSGDAAALDVLISGGADCSLINADKNNPLHVAVCGQQYECAKRLITAYRKDHSTEIEKTKLDASFIDAKNHEECTPLHYACLHGHLKLSKLLIENGADIHALDQEGGTPLHKAVISGNASTVTLLLDQGAKVNVCNVQGVSPLALAAFFRHDHIALRLLTQGSDPVLADSTGNSALHNACYSGSPELLSAMLASLPPRSDTDASKAAAAKAEASGSEREELLARSARSAHVRTSLNSALHHAAWSGDSGCVYMLLNAGAEPITLDADGASALHKAAFRQHFDALSALLDGGSDPNQADTLGSTALHKACYGGGLLLVKRLIRAGAKVEAADVQGCLPIHCAAARGHVDCVKELLKAGADATQADHSGVTAVHFAARRGDEPVLRALLGSITIPFTQLQTKEQKLSPLHFAVSNSKAVTVLCKELGRLRSAMEEKQAAAEAEEEEDSGTVSKSDSVSGVAVSQWVDTVDAKGRSALHYAVLNSQEAAARVLVLAGADPHLGDKKGRQPFDMPTRISEDVLEALRRENERQTDIGRRARWKATAKRFAENPKEGIVHAVQNELIEDDEPASIAKFLFECELLDKARVGEFMGGHKPRPVAVLDAFMKLFEFKEYSFDQALRFYLSKFRLPGEAQVIDRYMERFALRFHTCNPGYFSHEDTAYILAFSTIMLNTDAHNPQVKNKMSVDEFVGNNRGIDSGQDLPRDFLEDLYHSIVNNEIKMKGEGELQLFQSAEKKGFLTKQGGRVKTWKRRWFILTDNCVYYFKRVQDKDPCGIIPLENLAVRKSAKGKKFQFEIYTPSAAERDGRRTGGHGSGSTSGSSEKIKSCKVASDGALVKGHHDSYQICASSEEEMNEWIAAIKSNILGNPVYELLRKRGRLQQQEDSNPSSSNLAEEGANHGESAVQKSRLGRAGSGPKSDTGSLPNNKGGNHNRKSGGNHANKHAASSSKKNKKSGKSVASPSGNDSSAGGSDMPTASRNSMSEAESASGGVVSSSESNKKSKLAAAAKRLKSSASTASSTGSLAGIMGLSGGDSNGVFPGKAVDPEGNVDFALLLRFARCCESAFAGADHLTRGSGGALHVKVNTVSVAAGLHYQLFAHITTEPTNRRHMVVVHRDTWDGASAAKEALLSQSSPKKMQIAKLTQQLCSAILNKTILQRDFDVDVCGFGLGGVHACALAIMLMKKSYQVSQVVTFGQPRYLSPKEINSSVKGLPLVRCIVDTDPIPNLFSHAQHYGTEVVLLASKYYAYIPTPQPREIPKWTKATIEERFASHQFDEYITRLADKCKDAMRVAVSM